MKLEDLYKTKKPKKQPQTLQGQSNKFYTGDGRKKPIKKKNLKS